MAMGRRNVEQQGQFWIPTGQLPQSPGHVFLGPDGHGGTLTALSSTGLLELLRDRGIKHIFYFQVDNPLVKVADPQFICQHIRAKAAVSSKAILKDAPEGARIGESCRDLVGEIPFRVQAEVCWLLSLQLGREQFIKKIGT